MDDPQEYGGNVICAEKMRWRFLKNRMGDGAILIQENTAEE